VRETADCETPATLATSVDDGYFLARESAALFFFWVAIDGFWLASSEGSGELKSKESYCIAMHSG